MLDDIDRDICSHVQSIVIKAMKEKGWGNVEQKFRDPGWELLFSKMDYPHYGGSTKVEYKTTIKIQYGDKLDG